MLYLSLNSIAMIQYIRLNRTLTAQRNPRWSSRQRCRDIWVDKDGLPSRSDGIIPVVYRDLTYLTIWAYYSSAHAFRHLGGRVQGEGRGASESLRTGGYPKRRVRAGEGKIYIHISRKYIPNWKRWLCSIHNVVQENNVRIKWEWWIMEA